jgi:hypothetical protein
MSPKGFKPGQKEPASGQYGIMSRSGKRTGEKRTVTKGEPLPPTPHKGQTYVIVNTTRHKK